MVLFIGLVRDDWGYAPGPCSSPVGLAGITLVGNGGARGYVRPDVEQRLEVGTVRGFAAGQVEGDQVSATVGFSVDLGREAAARAAERLTALLPFAPAADTARARSWN
jgi:hypothetical protein